MGKSKIGSRSQPPPSASVKQARAKSPAAAVAIADDQRLVCEALAAVIATVPSLSVTLVTGDALDLLKLATKVLPTIAVIDVGMARHSGSPAGWHRTVQRRKSSCSTSWAKCPPAPRTRSRRRDVPDKSQQPGRFCRGNLASTVRQSGFPRRTAGTSDYSLARYRGRGRRRRSNAQTPHGTRAGSACLARGRAALVDCARMLGVSPNTIDNHKSRMMRKLAMHKTVELTRFAIRHGIVKDA